LSQQKENELEINKGIELMLRRVQSTPEKNGVNLNHKVTLLGRTFHFNLEFSWEQDNTKE